MISGIVSLSRHRSSALSSSGNVRLAKRDDVSSAAAWVIGHLPPPYYRDEGMLQKLCWTRAAMSFALLPLADCGLALMLPGSGRGEGTAPKYLESEKSSWD